MNLKKAQKYLEDVLEHKQCIPFKKYTGCIGRTAQAVVWGTNQGKGMTT
jgi:large subunit ribosomal protein L17e